MRTGIVLVVGVTLLLLAGCATTEPIWFIATPGYVEAQIAGSEAAMRLEYEQLLAQKERQIADLQEEVDAQRRVSEELSVLADVIREVEASNRELQGLASEVEVRLREVPEDTIRLIVEVLSQYLQDIDADQE